MQPIVDGHQGIQQLCMACTALCIIVVYTICNASFQARLHCITHHCCVHYMYRFVSSQISTDNQSAGCMDDHCEKKRKKRERNHCEVSKAPTTCKGLLLAMSMLPTPLLLALLLGSKAWLKEGTGLLLLVQSRVSWPAQGRNWIIYQSINESPIIHGLRKGRLIRPYKAVQICRLFGQLSGLPVAQSWPVQR